MTREPLFMCRFTSRSAIRWARVRAWDEREAAQLFRAELNGEEIHERGTIHVTPIGTRPAHGYVAAEVAGDSAS